MSTTARLPPELLLQVVESVVPPRSRCVAYEPSHAVTRTLIALTLVSRTTYAAATQNLIKHCLYIDSPNRLRLLLNRLAHPNSPTPTVPDLNLKQHVSSLYLAPFGRNIDDLPTAIWIRELLSMTRGTLRRLVTDIPFRSVTPWDDHLNVRAILRKAFEQLTKMEEFVSVRDDLYLELHDPLEGVDEPPVWQSWTRLKRLALCNVRSNPSFWHDLATMDHLDNLVLTCADGLEDFDFKLEYFSRSSRGLSVHLANVAFEQPEELHRESWYRSDKDGKMRVTLYDIPQSYYGDEDVKDVCQDWVKNAALKATLWNWNGTSVCAVKPAGDGSDEYPAN